MTRDSKPPDSPTKVSKGSWGHILKRTVKEFKRDELTDRAAGLTYYGILALFPALLVLVAMLGIAGESATRTVLDNIQKLAPGAARDVITNAVTQLQSSGGTSTVLAIVGLLGALWAASGYIAAFIRASNVVYDVPEGRPVWKILPVRVGLTLLLMVLACASALIVVLSGGLARQLGTALGVGDTAMTVWSIAKWPLLVVLVAIMLAVLYWAAPNAKDRGFKFISLGSLLALVIWLVASAGFAFYVANFGSYNKTYGALMRRHHLPGLAVDHQSGDSPRPRIRRGDGPRTGRRQRPPATERTVRRAAGHPEVDRRGPPGRGAERPQPHR